MDTRLKAARVGRAWSQARLMHEMEQQAGRRGVRIAGRDSLKVQISRWENGKSPPSETYRQLFRDVYGSTDEELGFIQNPSELAELGMLADALRLQVESTRGSLDRELVHQFQLQTDAIRISDRRLGASHLLGMSRELVGQMRDLRSYAVLRVDRCCVAAALSDTASLAGWQALDLGLINEAWTFHEIAKDAARESGSAALLAHAMGEQAFALVEIDQPRLAVRLVEEARQLGGRRIPAVLLTWLFAAEGETRAATGDVTGARHAFERAWRSLPSDPSDPSLPYLSLDDVHLGRWWGHVLARLGDVEAVQLLKSTLDRMDPTFRRATAALHCDLAAAYIALGDRDQARVHAQEARWIADQTHSLRQRRRIEGLALADAV